MVWRSCLVWSGNCSPILLGGVCLSDAPFPTPGEERWRWIFFGRGVILGRLVSGSPMMWVTGVEQVLHRHNQPLDGESGLPTMETRYWHPLSSTNVCRRWRALDLDPSWQLHCSHNSLMAPLAGSHPSRLSQTFIIEIGLLICFPSAFSSRFLQKTYLHIHACTCHGRVFI